MAAAGDPADLEAGGGQAEAGADGAGGDHRIVLGVEEEGGDAQVRETRGHAGAGVVVGGVGEAVAGGDDAVVPLADGADAADRGGREGAARDGSRDVRRCRAATAS